MVLFNYSTRELTAKIVYYGPGICGKTTNLQFIHENLPGAVRGKMLSLATKTDRTLFFDFLPIDLGEIRGMKTRVQLYTVPGQVFYNETRKLVLKGVDGIVFVADSQETMLGANVESFKNLEENLRGHGMKLSEIPHVIQFNKRDLPKLSSIEDMNAALNKYNAPFYESVAPTGIGVQDTLKAMVKLVLLNLTRKYEQKSTAEPASAAKPAAVAPSPVVAPPVAVPAMASAAAPSASGARAGGAVADLSTGSVSVTSAPSRSVPLSPAEPPHKAPPPAPETLTSFGEDEIDGLVGEVEDVEPAPAATPASESAWIGMQPGEAAVSDASLYGASVPIDELIDKTPKMTTAEPSRDHAPAVSSNDDMRLTEVASDDDLFSDPSLDVAQMACGETKEILVPVMLGEGASARRFKLAIRLRLDPVK